MKKGRIQKVNWEYYTTKFSLPQIMEDSRIECGAYALHAITKVPYKKIAKLRKDGHWPDRVMFGFLKKHGFSIVPITIGSMVEPHSVKGPRTKPLLDKNNLILIEQACYKEENTWAVLYDNKIMHSGEIEDLEPLEFINWPIEAAYLITHKSKR